MKKLLFIFAVLIISVNIAYSFDSRAGRFSKVTNSGNIYYTKGYIGIGINAPLSLLHLGGTVGSLAEGLSFGDGDSGFYEFTDDSIYLNLSGAINYKFQSNFLQFGADGSYPGIMRETASTTNPVFCPVRNGSTSGLGGSDNYILSLITNGLEIVNISTNSVTVSEVDAVFSNDIAISSRSVGSQSWLLYQSSVTTVTQDVYALIAGTSTLNSDSAWFTLATDAYGNDNRLTYKGTRTHKFFVNLNACLSDVSAAATTVTVQIYKNGTGTGFIANQYNPVQAKVENIGLGQIISLSTDDYLEVYATTDDGDDLAVCQMHLNAIPID